MLHFSKKLTSNVNCKFSKINRKIKPYNHKSNNIVKNHKLPPFYGRIFFSANSYKTFKLHTFLSLICYLISIANIKLLSRKLQINVQNILKCTYTAL